MPPLQPWSLTVCDHDPKSLFVFSMTSIRPSPSKRLSPRRRKAAIACDPCRNRKHRCDGVQPVCGSCSKRSQKCIFKVPSAAAARTNEYVESLVNRIAFLEKELEAARTNRPSSSNHPAKASSSELNQVVGPSQDESVLGDAISSVDAMGANMGPADHPDASNKFYGSSSALSFMRLMYSTILGRDSMVSSNAANASSSFRSPAARSTTSGYTTSEHFSLLPRDIADKCILLYWSRVHVLYPFLHKSSFQRAYEELWKSSASHSRFESPGLGLGASTDAGPSSVVFHCALNAALALGMQFSNLSIEEKNRLSGACLDKSMNLLKFDLFDDTSISLIQTLLLLTQYFQSTNCPNRCWTSIGLACRLAQGLGLHLDDNSGNRFDPVEREIRKRVWHGCVTLDIAVSMTLGRPTMLIGQPLHSLPTPVDEDEWVPIEDKQDHTASTIDFFREAILLYRILGRILLSVYKLNDQQTEKPEVSDGYATFDILIEIDNDLSKFACHVPALLSWTRYTDHSDNGHLRVLSLQSHVLHVRFAHARILLYRPIFFQFCRRNSVVTHSNAKLPGKDDLSPSGVATSLAFHCALTCVKTAVDLIEAIEKYSGLNTTGAWWYNMYYTRNAAMVLLLAGICPMIYDSIGGEAWNAAWSGCRNILVNNLPQYPPVKICLTTLEALRHHILRHRSHAQATPSTDATGSISETRVPSDSFDEPVQHVRVENEGNGMDTFSFDRADMDALFDPMLFLEADLISDLGFASMPAFSI